VVIIGDSSRRAVLVVVLSTADHTDSHDMCHYYGT